jgi:hypothetical protein
MMMLQQEVQKRLFQSLLPKGLCPVPRMSLPLDGSQGSKKAVPGPSPGAPAPWALIPDVGSHLVSCHMHSGCLGVSNPPQLVQTRLMQRVKCLVLIFFINLRVGELEHCPTLLFVPQVVEAPAGNTACSRCSPMWWDSLCCTCTV